MTHTVSISNTNEEFRCDAAQSLLGAMEALGRKGIPVGCRGGGCGVCKVRIDTGRVHAQPMSRACVSVQEQRQGFVLACRAYPRSDVTATAVDKLARCLERSAPASFLSRARLSSPSPNTTEGDSPCR